MGLSQLKPLLLNENDTCQPLHFTNELVSMKVDTIKLKSNLRRKYTGVHSGCVQDLCTKFNSLSMVFY